TLKHGGEVKQAVFSPDGRLVVTASVDKTARVWEAATGLPLTPRLKHPATVMLAAFNRDASRLVTVSADGTARVWGMQPDKRPPVDLLTKARLLAGQELDRADGIKPLDAADLSQAWKDLRARFPTDFAP